MKSKWRRYEVLLPTKFNDGRSVPDDKDRWKTRLEQIELWMVSYQINIE